MKVGQWGPLSNCFVSYIFQSHLLLWTSLTDVVTVGQLGTISSGISIIHLVHAKLTYFPKVGHLGTIDYFKKLVDTHLIRLSIQGKIDLIMIF